jgi:hypothetical protein
MTTIYCSAKLSTLLGLPKKPRDNSCAAVDPHVWNAMLFYLNKRKCLLFTHKARLYSFLALDVVKKDLVDFPKFFRQHFTDQLLADQLISEKAKLMLEQDYGSIILKPTDGDRKVIGSMNDCIFRVRYYMGRDDEDGRSKSPTYIAHQFNKTPMGAIDYAHPVDLMKQYLTT